MGTGWGTGRSLANGGGGAVGCGNYGADGPGSLNEPTPRRRSS